MKTYRKTPCLLMIMVGLTVSSVQAKNEHWGYEGKLSAPNWGSLHADFALCSSGKAQSPINIQNNWKKAPAKLSVNYQNKTQIQLQDLGFTIQANLAKGSHISIQDKTYQLIQFHFHTPGEHQLNGKLAPAEFHFVHQSTDGALAVIGVNVVEGKDNPALKGIVQQLDQLKKHKRLAATDINLRDLLPKDTTYYHYPGSLTTPPCSESVQWHLMKTPITLSAQSIQALDRYYSFNNNRPVQSLHDRKIEASKF